MSHASDARPIFIYASQSGKAALDQGEGGGNPFASAFIEILSREDLSLSALLKEIVVVTQAKSRGFQVPEVSAPPIVWRQVILPMTLGEINVALVVVFSDYSTSDLAGSLPGAWHDQLRVSSALRRSGFEVRTALDPGPGELVEILRNFSKRSEAAKVSVLYTTGHGVEVNGLVYLLPGGFKTSYGQDGLETHAIPLRSMGAALKAQRANLLLYGGCRTNPFRGR